ncbi:MAG: MCE family protein [Kiritimatiellae bacterium]|nr:MCE family protein [Kiritimatiellia bacterium]
MSRSKASGFSDLVTGVFMLSVLALLGYFTIVISGIDLITGKEKVDVRVVFDQVGGLKDHDNVMYRGTKVGTVDRIVLGDREVTVIMNIDKDVILREGYTIRVQSMSLLGGNLMVLEEGEGLVLDLLSTDFKGQTPTDWMKDVQDITANLNKITSSGEIEATISNLKSATEKVNNVIAKVESGEGTVGKLIQDDSVYEDLKVTVANAREVTDEFKGVRTVIENVTQITEKLKDDKYYDELEKGLTAFRTAFEHLDMGEDLKASANEVVVKANDLLGTLNNVAARLEQGEGTLGKLATDDTMYNEINALIRDMRQVIDNYRDTTPISTFGSLATGAL